jgi:hypothetical protein
VTANLIGRRFGSQAGFHQGAPIVVRFIAFFLSRFPEFVRILSVSWMAWKEKGRLRHQRGDAALR